MSRDVPKDATARLTSLDAYRGLIMVALAFEGFGLAGTARRHLEADPDSGFWAAVKYQFSHAEWVGCGFWDMIQPSFMFMVGVSMAFSYAKRSALGEAWSRMLRHAMIRAFALVFLGIFLISNWSDSTNWSLMNVLTQIGLGYPFLFLLWNRPLKVQGGVAAGVLLATWLLYVAYPAPGIDPTVGAPERGVKAEWAAEHLAGVGQDWHKNANVGHVVDVHLLNLLPQEKPFEYNRGGYQSINFIPSLATMLFGLMCGEWLRSGRTGRDKVLRLVQVGAAGLVVGQLLNLTGLCPLVKRIWTPSWAVFSTGWCCWILGGLYWVIEIRQQRRWAFPLVVVGMNSMAMYCMGMLLKGWVTKTLKIHLGGEVFDLWGPLWEPFWESTLVGLVFWGVCYWMYRRKLFLRL